MENKISYVKKIVRLAFVLFCVCIVIVGQKNIGYFGLILMLMGVVGLLVSLGLYNRKFK